MVFPRPQSYAACPRFVPERIKNSQKNPPQARNPEGLPISGKSLVWILLSARVIAPFTEIEDRIRWWWILTGIAKPEIAVPSFLESVRVFDSSV